LYFVLFGSAWKTFSGYLCKALIMEWNVSAFCHQWSTMDVLARLWWLMPVILTTQEAEIMKIAVQSQPRQIVQEKTHHKKGR
jgi:hypothetical protein